MKAWVGGPDFKHFQYDHVAQARRQVGSTFKALRLRHGHPRGHGPCTELPNQRMPSTCPRASPTGARRTATAATAVMDHVEVRAVQLREHHHRVAHEAVWPSAVTVLARHMGWKARWTPCLRSAWAADLTLEEMTAAFAAFANEGVYIEPMVFTRIEDKNGNTVFDVTRRP